MPTGTIVDVKISYPQDLMTQMLEYSERAEPEARSRPPEA